MGQLNILVMGLGFVGLTAGLGFADNGMHVFGYDSDKKRTEEIKSGYIPFFEPGLPDALTRNLGKNFNVLNSISDFEKATKLDAVFFCVGTPCDNTGSVCLSHLESAIDSIAEYINDTCILVIKSTVPPGTTQNEIIPYIRSKNLNNPVAVNPEFLREGWCWSDFTAPDRIVCGTNDENAKHILSDIYSPFNAPIYYVSPGTSEFIKYLSNSLLANLISFSNEMALIAEAAGDITVGSAFKILHEDSRLSGSGISHYIYPGCGYGGYCLPKDTTALIQNALKNGVEPKILSEVTALNAKMPALTVKRVLSAAKSKTEKIGILGLSFKPNSDDVRDSPSAKIISELIKEGYTEIYAYDPVANDNFASLYALPIKYCTSKEDLCKTCNTVVLITIWPEFKGINRNYPDIKFVDCRYFL